MEAKKISFSFSKINKKSNLLPTKENVKTETKVELIKCLEGQEIKLVEEASVELPLIIPLKESQKTSAALASLMKRRAVLLGEEESESNIDYSVRTSNNECSEDIEKRAARELLAEIEKNDSTAPANNLVLPVVKPEDLPLEGAKESSLDDYASVPIQDFGKAMLRGMGWTEPSAKTNKKSGPPIDDTPMVRPKGMGLGADKALKKKTLLVSPEANEVLGIKRNAHVIILGGKHKDLYGKIEGFDDYAGRVIVKMAIGGAKEAFNEFLCQPVSRQEYAQYGKCINTSKYEEYKKKENEYGQIILDKDEKEFVGKSENIKKERRNSIKDKYQKNKGDYDGNRKREYHIKDKNDIKSESGIYREHESSNRNKEQEDRHAYGSIIYSRYEDRESTEETSKFNKKDRRNEVNRDDVRDSRSKFDDRDKKEDHRDRSSYRLPEHDKYELKSNSHSQMSRRNADDYYKKPNSREYETSDNRDRDRLREHKRESDKSKVKTAELHNASNSENNSYSAKHSDSKKADLKKKLKKSKKKYKRNSSDSETTSSSVDSSSDSEEEKRKKHKKKTKKSKRQRERSRSRGRR